MKNKNVRLDILNPDGTHFVITTPQKKHVELEKCVVKAPKEPPKETQKKK